MEQSNQHVHAITTGNQRNQNQEDQIELIELSSTKKIKKKIKLPYMKFLKKKIFWIILIIILVVVLVVYSQGKKNKQIEYVTDQVKLGDLIQSVSATGNVESASETNLNFKITGKLAGVYVVAGDRVDAGKLLAGLGSSQAQSAVVNTQAQLAEAQADLEGVIAGSSDEDIAVAQVKVNQAQADLDTKEVVLDNIIIEKEQNLLSYKEQALDEADESIFLIQESLEDIDEIINGDDETYLKIYNISYSLAWSSYNNAVPSLDSLEEEIINNSVSNSVDDLVSLLDQVSSVLDDADSALRSTFNLLINVSPVGSLTQSDIDSYKSTTIINQSNISTNISSVQTAKSNLQIKSVEYDNDIEEAELEIEEAETALSLAEAELAQVLAEPRSFEIKLQQAKVNMAQAKLQSALADLSDYSLRSPITGIITKVNYEVGEYVSSAEPVISLISESNLEIEVDVPESDIAKVKVSDEAEITLDAFGEERIFTSHISFIDPAETIINDVVYYKVKLTFDEKDESIKSGMTANVVITTNSKEDILYIPQRAVISPNGESFVRVLVNKQIEEKKITTGLKGDGGLIEITSGLVEGEEIITYIKNGK